MTEGVSPQLDTTKSGGRCLSQKKYRKNHEPKNQFKRPYELKVRYLTGIRKAAAKGSSCLLMAIGL
ncbi:hypothetical protein [Peribacillus deserti]|nr:hypothetical protein [Peribacillus deserti]